MPDQIAAVVKDTKNFDYAWLPMPEQHEVPRRLDHLIVRHMRAAKGEVIAPKSRLQVLALLRRRTLRIVGKVGDRLIDQRFIAQRGSVAEPLHSPCPDIGDVVESWRGNPHFVRLAREHRYGRALPALRTKELISARERNAV